MVFKYLGKKPPVLPKNKDTWGKSLFALDLEYKMKGSSLLQEHYRGALREAAKELDRIYLEKTILDDSGLAWMKYVSGECGKLKARLLVSAGE